MEENGENEKRTDEANEKVECTKQRCFECPPVGKFVLDKLFGYIPSQE